MALFTHNHHRIMNNYRALYYAYPMDSRYDKFNKPDLEIIEKTYNDWRQSDTPILFEDGCSSCVEEAFERLMNAMINFEKLTYKTVDSVT